MAKKSSNPADAFRKAQRAKELKKNKEQRKKVREVQTVKRDTRDLEAEIRSLKDKKDNASKSRIAELESELAYVLKTKEAYVKEHPEARDKVFGRPKGSGGRRIGDEDDNAREEEEDGVGKGKGKERLYDEQGRLRDPTRSIYYDPVYNPWGVPPPGMPYQEKPGLEVEAQSDSEADSDEDDSDEDIIMPDGPPPGGSPSGDEDSDDSNDIPLPPGPPPPKAAPPPPPSGPSAWGGRPAPVPIPFHQPPPMGAPIHMGMGMGMPYPPFPPPQPQPGFQNQPFYPPSGPSNQTHRVRPMRHNGPSNVQDPLSDEPTQTYQGYRMTKAEANLPPRPTLATGSGPLRLPPSETPGSGTGAGEITAAPVLRDLRKETTVFVPRNLKKKGPASSLAGPGGSGGRINAAPGAGTVDEEGDEVLVRKTDRGLMGKLKGVLGSEVGVGVGGGTVKASADEDYERFLAGLGDIS